MHVVMLQVDFTIAPSTPFLTLHLQESGESHVEFVAWYSGDSRYERVRGVFERCIAGRLLHRGFEAPPRPRLGLLTDSEWLRETNSRQAERHPDFPDNFEDMNHYYFHGHDASVEVLAEGIRFETVERLAW